MQQTTNTCRAIREGDVLRCPACNHELTVSRPWILSVRQSRKVLNRSTQSLSSIEDNSPSHELPRSFLELCRCSNCKHRGAVVIEARPDSTDATSAKPALQTEVPVRDPYNITSAEAKAVIASRFFGKSRNLIIMMHNQIDNLDLNFYEIAALKTAFRNIGLRSQNEWGGNGGMAVTSKPSGLY